MLGFEGWWGLPALPKLNVQQPPDTGLPARCRLYWPRFGIDGWRLDVAEGRTPAADFWWSSGSAAVRSARMPTWWPRSWQPKPEWLTGQHFDALMNYPLAEAMLGYAAGRHLDLRVASQHDEYRRFVVPRDGASFAAELERLHHLYDPDVTSVMLNLLGSHDAPRARTVCGCDLAAMRIATVLQMTLPGAPCIDDGDEVGLEGEQDPYNRGGFPWERDRWDHGLRAFVRDLVGLRKRHRALRDGELHVLATDGARLPRCCGPATGSRSWSRPMWPIRMRGCT